jgi:hypothetical protein
MNISKLLLWARIASQAILEIHVYIFGLWMIEMIIGVSHGMFAVHVRLNVLGAADYREN